MSVIRQWFAALHQALDQLIRRYPEAGEEERARLQEQADTLKTISDEMVENWLLFEDKLALFQELEQQEVFFESAEPWYDPFQKGQGYFKLRMFPQAAEHLEETIRLFPDLLAARLILAMTRMHLKEWPEAQQQFRLIAALADDAKLQAIAYNALGCIQAVNAQWDQARQLFQKALEADPTFADPQKNLESCRRGGGELQLQFGMEFQAMG